MDTLLTLDIKDYDPEYPHSKRPSSRAIIIFDKDGKPADYSHTKVFPEDYKIVLVHSTKYDYYKFPGGGIKEKEENEDALCREVREEVGLTVVPRSIKEYGMTRRLQYSNTFTNTVFEQNSYYYFCNVELSGEQDTHLLISSQQLDPYEAEAGFELSLISLKDAIRANQTSLDEDPFSIVMIERDTRVLSMLAGREPDPLRLFSRFLLTQSVKRNPGPWEKHSILVAECAEKIAWQILRHNDELNDDGSIKENCSINPEKAYTLGLLHDIGRRNGITGLKHVWDGYHYLKDMGYDDAARICLTHSFQFPELSFYIGEKDLEPDQMEELKKLLQNTVYDDYDYLIQLLDATCSADGTKNMERRMNDVKLRYGSYPLVKWARNLELKKLFEEKMGAGLYDII